MRIFEERKLTMEEYFRVMVNGCSYDSMEDLEAAAFEDPELADDAAEVLHMMMVRQEIDTYLDQIIEDNGEGWCLEC